MLNAKHHEQEAEIVAEAGRLGAVTIATNMAGRGTDIILGGNPDFEARKQMRKEGYTPEQISFATGFEKSDDPEMLEARANSTVAITAIRGVSDTITLNVPLDESGRMGVLTRGIVPRTREYGFFESIPAGISLAGEKIASYWQQLKMIFNPETKSYKEVGGFIAIGSIFPETWNWYSFWSLTAFLSVILAVMNILPIPGLDGGHALFTLWEIITRRKPSDKFLEIMQYIGFGLLILLLVYANANDIIRLFN